MVGSVQSHQRNKSKHSIPIPPVFALSFPPENFVPHPSIPSARRLEQLFFGGSPLGSKSWKRKMYKNPLCTEKNPSSCAIYWSLFAIPVHWHAFFVGFHFWACLDSFHVAGDQLPKMRIGVQHCVSSKFPTKNSQKTIQFASNTCRKKPMHQPVSFRTL